MSEYKTWVVDKLESWAETFNNNYPEHMEDIIEEENQSYELIQNLVVKFLNNNCSKEEYEEILFHIWQSNQNL